VLAADVAAEVLALRGVAGFVEAVAAEAFVDGDEEDVFSGIG